MRNIYILILLSLSFGTVTDIDGNTYETVQIGEQLWMAENLRTTQYNNGNEIPLSNCTTDMNWDDLSSGAYCDYDNDPTNSETYGRLYNGYTVDDNRGVCPVYWHIPSDEEFMDLEMYLGMSEEDANKIGQNRGINEGSKLADNWDVWFTGDLKNDSEFGTSGFTGLPAGCWFCDYNDFTKMGESTTFWTSSIGSVHDYYVRLLSWDDSRVAREDERNSRGFSIRCVRNATAGCTDPEACNYDEIATEDDGSCLENDCAAECGGSAAQSEQELLSSSHTPQSSNSASPFGTPAQSKQELSPPPHSPAQSSIAVPSHILAQS
jgi:uncharacterized protein (TIGR02145 family)